MDEKRKQRIWTRAAMEIALHCVRNTQLENLHAGCFPETRTGDYTDVKVIDGEGNEIPWNSLSRVSDEEMKAFIKEVVNKIFTYGTLGDNQNLRAYLDDTASVMWKWDKSQLYAGMEKCAKLPYTPISREP